MATEAKLRQLADKGCPVYYFYSSERYLVLEWGGVLLDDAGVGHFVCAWCGLLRVGMIFTCHT